MKKVMNKEIIMNIIIFISFIALPFYMNIYARSLVNLTAYGFVGLRYSTLWIGFSLSWSLLMFLVLLLFKRKARIIVYNILIISWSALFFAQICYVQQFGKFMIFSDIFLAGEGLQYIKSIFINMNLGMILTIIFEIMCMISVFILYKKSHKQEEVRPNKWIILILVTLVIIFKLTSYLSLGKISESNSWQENYNVKSIYVNFTNPNTSMFVSGFYEYNLRAIYKYFYNLITLDKETLRNSIDKYNNTYGISLKENEYTGIFKDKNVIYIMMESIDSWIIDEETMPNLTMMKKTGLNFTNRYSPFFNGGQTINSEFSCNTGMYAISDKATIYDIDDVDYKYSIANMLKNNGYAVNSFHANTGTFYNRSKFHSLLGYEHHYSFVDMQKAGDLPKDTVFFSDYNAIKNKTINDLIINQSKRFYSFITTYSAHLEYTNSNKVYKTIKHSLDKKNYSEEEYIYRTLANDTDKFLGEIIESLKEKNLIDNTVIVLVTDHYVYGYSDPEYVAVKKNVINDRKLLQNTPFIIWSADMESKNIDTILDTADILPTLLNLLGIQYDPNKYLGTDIFSEAHDDFVYFSDGTFIKSPNCNQSDEAILTKINYNISKNKSILLTNYYGK